MSKMLIVEDEKFMREVLKKFLEKQGFEVLTAENGIEALKIRQKEEFSLMITDLKMPEMDGKELIRTLRESGDKIPIIVMTAFGSMEEAVDCMKQGANDFITKPFEMNHLLRIISNLFDKKSKKFTKKDLKTNLIGKSPALINAIELAKRAAEKDITVLILGETGAGKELFAQLVHNYSKRSNKPFIPVNCNAIPTELIESELFGYKKGAFTGAYQDKDGIFKAADSGTVFLDEIGDLPQSAQVKLLRFLEDSSFIRVGDVKPIKTNVRLIFATNKDLNALIKANRFRQDLYYRINIFPIYIPPLRERKDDIEILIPHFLKQINPQKKMEIDVVEILKKYKWPGNIRELKHFVERISIIDTDDTITIDDIPPDFFNGVVDVDIGRIDTIENFIGVKNKMVRKFEFNYFSNLLDSSGWNINKAARLSGLSRKTIYQKIDELKLSKEGHFKE